MDLLFEKLLEVSRARWWQLVAAMLVGGSFVGSVAGGAGWLPEHASFRDTVAGAAPYALGGAAVGFVAGGFLLWVDAGQRAREARGGTRLTVRERFLLACLILGFALGGFSILCCALMTVVRAVQFVVETL
jgi:hypothetical protein